jgi:predicted O-methyltransferase YrrM
MVRRQLTISNAMGQIIADAIEAYLHALNQAADPLLERVAARGRALDLPLVDAEVGALLELLVRATGARRVLEIGTAIGYSGLWLARGLPGDGQLITIDIDHDRAAEARRLFEEAGLSGRATVIAGDAARYVAKVSGPFDIIFLDSDKELYGPLHERLVALLRPGGLLVVDNALWSGDVVPGFNATPIRDPAVTRLIAEYNERLARDPRLLTSFVPLRDGLALAVKRRPDEPHGAGV